MQNVISAPLPIGATPIAIIHCYADVPVGTQYDVAFDPSDPKICEATYAEVLFAVVMGRIVELGLSHGWHQTAVLRFSKGMPKLFNQLPMDHLSSRYLGLCSQADFPEIRLSLPGVNQPSGEAKPPTTRS